MVQEVTLTKSPTKEGMLHLKMAELPRITYSSATPTSKFWLTTEGGRGRLGISDRIRDTKATLVI